MTTSSNQNMNAIDKADDELLDILESNNRDRIVGEVALSRIERGSISAELLSLVVDEEDSSLDNEKEVLKSLRGKSRGTKQ